MSCSSIAKTKSQDHLNKIEKYYTVFPALRIFPGAFLDAWRVLLPWRLVVLVAVGCGTVLLRRRGGFATGRPGRLRARSCGAGGRGSWPLVNLLWYLLRRLVWIEGRRKMLNLMCSPCSPEVLFFQRSPLRRGQAACVDGSLVLLSGRGRKIYLFEGVLDYMLVRSSEVVHLLLRRLNLGHHVGIQRELVRMMCCCARVQVGRSVLILFREKLRR